VKMVLTPAGTPDEYVACLDNWQQAQVQALRAAVLESVPRLEERLKWGHLVYFLNGPVLLIRAEPQRVLFGFWRGQKLRHIEPRLKPGGKYQMATLQLVKDTPLERATVLRLAQEASALNQSDGDPTQDLIPSSPSIRPRLRPSCVTPGSTCEASSRAATNSSSTTTTPWSSPSRPASAAPMPSCRWRATRSGSRCSSRTAWTWTIRSIFWRARAAACEASG
jgi:hypothetical protein